MAKRTGAKSRKTPATVERIEPPATLAPFNGGPVARLNQTPTASLGNEAESYVKAPYLGFYSERMSGSKAAELVQAVGAIQPGQAFVKDGDDYHLVDNWRVALLAEFKFYGNFDFSNKGRIRSAYAPGQEPEHLTKRGAPEDERLTESYLVVLCHIPPTDNKTPVFSVCRILGPQTYFIRDLARGVTDAGRPSFATRAARVSSDLAEALMHPDFPIRLRNPGALVPELIPSGSSPYPYLKVSARVGVLKPAEYMRLARFWADPETQERLTELLDVFDVRVDEVRDIIADTADRGAPAKASPADVSF